MRPTDMHRLSHGGCHINGPQGWHDVPVVSGDYDLDATILHRDNKNMPKRLNLYVKRGGAGYGPRTGYNGYKTYSGDA
jgi:hypothetical protein